MPSDPNSVIYLNELDRVVAQDVQALLKAQKSYGNSWKKRGGIGAFMMLARKWDRLEQVLTNPTRKFVSEDVSVVQEYNPYDVFGAIETDRRAEGVIDTIRDLRRYLLLVEAEAIAHGFCPGQLAKDIEDGSASKGGKEPEPADPSGCGEKTAPARPRGDWSPQMLAEFEHVKSSYGVSVLHEAAIASKYSTIQAALDETSSNRQCEFIRAVCTVLVGLGCQRASDRLISVFAPEDEQQPTASQLHPK